MYTVPNQRIVKIHRIKPEGNFLGIKNEHWQAAARDLGAQGLMLYLYLSANADNFSLALSPSDIRNTIGMPPTTYRSHFQNLIKKGYLVPKHDGSNIYDFFEVPQRATCEVDESTSYVSTQTCEDFPRAYAVENRTAEDIEINIDNYKYSIYNCGEKQVSPSQSKTEFVF